MKSSLILFVFFILSLLLKPGVAQDDCDCSMDLPKSQIYIYFENINDTIAGLGSLQSAGGVSTGAPPDFSVSEKGLFDLAKEIDHATHALQNIDGTLDDNNVELINQYLHDSAQEVVVITNGIKQAKVYSDAQGYTTWENRIMKALAAQLSILFPELLHHLPPTVYASVGYSISLWVCSMADAIEYLEPGSHSYQGTEFCQSLSPGMTSIPDQSQLESIIKVPQCFYDCGASILAMLVYGYTYGLVGQPQTAPWCPDGIGPYSSIWDFVPSSFQWVVQVSTSDDGSSK